MVFSIERSKEGNCLSRMIWALENLVDQSLESIKVIIVRPVFLAFLQNCK